MAGFFGVRDGIRLTSQQFKAQLNRVYSWYTAGFVLFVLVLAVAERMGLPRLWIGFTFLTATFGLYAGIGVMSRTRMQPNITWRAGVYQRSTTAWQRVPIGCPLHRLLGWPERST